MSNPYLPTSEPEAAYVHVPFCAHHCGYCNFTVIAGHDDLADAYLAALERELALLERPREVRTLYVGGGTPTHLDPPRLRRLCGLLRQWFTPITIENQFEYTFEANPETLDADRLKVLSDSGINRLSLGAQSFQDRKIHALDRRHTAADVERSVAAARDHIGNVSLDLIFAAPDETLAEWQTDLRRAIDLGLDHISTYGLTYEQGTLFWNRWRRGDLAQLEDDLEREMYEMAIDQLTTVGWEHYEVSNFARPGRRSRHNGSYWLGRPYFGIGAGASRYVNGQRATNHRSTRTYIRRMLAGDDPTAEVDELAPIDRVRERFVFALRRVDGVNCHQFAAATGFDVYELAGAAIAKFTELELLVWDGDILRMTRAGLLVSDSMWPDFLRP